MKFALAAEPNRRCPSASAVRRFLRAQNRTCGFALPERRAAPYHALNKATPKYQRHRASGQTVVTLGGGDFYLGPHGTKASKLERNNSIRSSNVRSKILDSRGWTMLKKWPTFMADESLQAARSIALRLAGREPRSTASNNSKNEPPALPPRPTAHSTDPMKCGLLRVVASASVEEQSARCRKQD